MRLHFSQFAAQKRADIRQEKRWLIVYDNADDSGLLMSSLPHRGNGAIIVTSQNKNIYRGLPASAKQIQVGGLTEKEAEDFLLARAGAVNADAGQRWISRCLAKKFRYWPLALRQLGAFVTESETPLDEVWEILSHNPSLEDKIYAYKDTSSLYERALLSAWDPILSRLPDKAANLLSVLSLFDPDKVPSQLLVSAEFLTDEFEYVDWG